MYHRHSNIFCMSRIKTQPPTPSMGHHLFSLPWFSNTITAPPTFTEWKSEENLLWNHEPYVTGSPSTEIYQSYNVTVFHMPNTFLFKSVFFKLSCCPLSGSQNQFSGLQPAPLKKIIEKVLHLLRMGTVSSNFYFYYLSICTGSQWKCISYCGSQSKKVSKTLV